MEMDCSFGDPTRPADILKKKTPPGMGEKSPGGRGPLKLDLDQIFSDRIDDNMKMITGTPVSSHIDDISVRAQLQLPVNKNSFELRAESPSLHLVFRDLASFYLYQSSFNKDKNLRSQRLILDKVQKSASSSTMVDHPIWKDKVVVSLCLDSFDNSNSEHLKTLESSKHELLKCIFSCDTFCGLKEEFDEANLVLPAKPVQNSSVASPTSFYLHLKANNEKALRLFDSLNNPLKQGGPLSLTFQGHSLRINECFVPKLSRALFSPPKATRAFMLRFSKALTPSNVISMNTWLVSALGESDAPRVVMGHPMFVASEPTSFVTIFLRDNEAQKGLSTLVSHIHPQDLVEPKRDSIIEYDPKSREQRACDVKS
jgi:hypothetical protein